MAPIPTRRLRHRAAAVLAATALGLVAAGCGGDGGGSATETEPPTVTEPGDGTDRAAGREVFTSSCGSCHVLADAGTSGSVGPNLDEAQFEREAVEQQVRNGGGGMPAFEGTLDDAQIESVSDYVVAASAGS